VDLINISPTEDPSKIAHIDMNNTLIMCVNENNTNVDFTENSIYLKNPSDISFNSQKILANNYTIINYSPNIKWCIPSYINLTFREPINFREKCYFSDIYNNTTYHLKSDKNTLVNYSFNIYVDRTRSREMGKIKKHEYMLEVNFEYKVFAEASIENVCLIKNNYCFQEFETHFQF
jgi:hypothetical protein